MRRAKFEKRRADTPPRCESGADRWAVFVHLPERNLLLTERQDMKKILKKLALFIGIILLLAGGYAGYAVLSYARLPDYLELKATAAPEAAAPYETGVSYKAITYNIGFGAYTPDFSFFMDGGISSWAKSKDSVEKTVAGAAALIAGRQPDLVAFQEVDIDGTRSYHVNQYQLLSETLPNFSHIFGLTYDSVFLIYPFHQPHGKNKSGIASYSRVPVESAVRRSLPIADSLSKFLDLDRAYTVARMKTADGKYLVFINAHLSAYGADEAIRTRQMEVLTQDLEREYARGNYVIVAGDFNHELKSEPEGADFSWTQPFPRELLPRNFQLAVDALSPKEQAELADSARNADIAYTPGVSQTFMVDGFIISDNIEVEKLTVLTTGFLYSDHEPVELIFRLK